MNMLNWNFAVVCFTFLSLLNSEVRGAAEAVADAPDKKVPPVYAPIKDDPLLPRVLLIGDSISIAYTLPVRKLLAKKANLHRPPDNCGPTIKGIEKLDRWLGVEPWDVIHFNFGLHDLKYIGPEDGNLDTPTGHQQVPLSQYEANLRKLAARLKKTGATLIWCSTTPVPKEGTSNRVAGDSVKYNEAALKVMRDNGIAVNDLHAFAKPRLSDIQRPRNVHFTSPGSRILAEQVAASIEAALARRKAATQQ